MDTETLGDRMKMYEQAEAGKRAMPLLPVLARLDGRSFHNYTRGLKRPFDENLSNLMIETTKFLVEETHAKIGYTQSDEISLILYGAEKNSSILFDGKYQKLTSVLAGLASAKFNSLVPKYLPAKVNLLAVFDCRVWQVPNLEEATNAILWRELDATKNAVSMAAQSQYSHKELQSKNQSEMQEMLWQKGINFNDYPTFFKRGTYLQKRNKEVELSEEALKKIPEKFRPQPGQKVVRSQIINLELPPLAKITNRVDVIFFQKEPVLAPVTMESSK